MKKIQRYEKYYLNDNYQYEYFKCIFQGIIPLSLTFFAIFMLNCDFFSPFKFTFVYAAYKERDD